MSQDLITLPQGPIERLVVTDQTLCEFRGSMSELRQVLNEVAAELSRRSGVPWVLYRSAVDCTWVMEPERAPESHRVDERTGAFAQYPAGYSR